MESVKKIYTRTGDRGMTSLRGGMRVSKTDPRIGLNGTLDELNVAIGAVRVLLSSDDWLQLPLKSLQYRLMDAMSLVATPVGLRHANPAVLSLDDVDAVETLIDRCTAEAGGAATHFVLPGGNLLSVAMHQARVVARRAERHLWSLDPDTVPDCLPELLNRMSDLFFEMARCRQSESDAHPELWRAFSH